MTAIGERLTPTAVVAGAHPPQTPDWYALRRTGIGSSDVAPALGLSAYRSAGHVWAEKRGDLPPDPGGEAAKWGSLLEDVIARDYAATYGVMVATPPTLRNVDHPHRMANLDRLVIGCPLDTTGDGCALEVKTRSAWVAGSWREDVPDDVLAQCQWQLLVTGLPHVHVACLIGGQRLVEHLVHPEAAVATYVAAQMDDLWVRVQTGERPPVDEAGLLLDLLDRLFPDRSGCVEVDPGEFEEIRTAYEAGRQAEAAGKALKQDAKAALLNRLGAGDTAVVGELVVATYRAHERTTVDAARLRRDHPDAYAACAVTNPVRTLRWK